MEKHSHLQAKESDLRRSNPAKIFERVRPVSQPTRLLRTQSVRVPTHWTAHDSVILTHLTDSPRLHRNSLPPRIIDIWHQRQWPKVRLTLLYLGTAGPFI